MIGRNDSLSIKWHTLRSTKMAGKKRKGGAASARLKTLKKKRKQQHHDDSDEEDAAAEPQTSQMQQMEVDATTKLNDDDDILTPELRAELGGNDGDVLVVVGRKAPRVKAEVVPEEIVQQAARLSKSKRKKLEQLAVCYKWHRWLLHE